MKTVTQSGFSGNFTGWISWAIAIMIVFTGVVIPQHLEPPAGERIIPLEVPDDPYLPSPRATHLTSPAYRLIQPDFFTVQVNVDSAGNNIVGDAANEPSIAIDPTDPAHIVIGWRQFDTITSNFRQAGYAYSFDGGLTWTFPGVLEPGIFRSDPVLDFDSAGVFYYNSLTVSGSDFHCNVFRSSDGGVTWDAGVFAFGGDKAWMVIDRTGGMGTGHIYSQWSQGIGACDPGHFTRSANGGDSYETCVQIPGSPFWGTLAVGSAGELYAAGSGFSDFVVAKSTTARDSAQAVSWDFFSTVSLGGDLVAFSGNNSPNPGGLLGQAWIATDVSGGPNDGNVYLLCSVDPNDSPDPLDVMFSRSTDGGVTWSTPVKINNDFAINSWQWFGTMSVAPNGRIDVVWLDTRDNPGTVLSSLYYAYSTDGGITWSANIRLTNEFDPHLGWPQQNKMGDYFDMVSFNDGAHLAWANTFNGEQDVYYAFIPAPIVGIAANPPRENVVQSFSLSPNYPNPFNPGTNIEFEIPNGAGRGSPTGQGEWVTLKIYDLLGREVKTLVNGQMAAGNHTVYWDGTDNNGNPVDSGVYLYRLVVNGVSLTRKMTLVK